jgi:hypothetical protein
MQLSCQKFERFVKLYWECFHGSFNAQVDTIVLWGI